jgi:hypothetical protein
MDLSNFQLADTINDIDMLRNLSEDQEEYNQKQMDSNFELQGNIDLLFQQNTNPSSHLNSYIAGYNNTSPATRSYQKQPISTVSPSYPPVSNSMSHNEYFDKEVFLNT